VPDFEKRDLYLLHHGRHFRLDPGTRIVVGRSEADNDMIETLYAPETDTLLRMVDLPGPLVLIPQAAPPDMAKRAAGICAGYTKAKAGQEVRVLVRSPAGERIIQVNALEPASFQDTLV
jgi:predicted ribosome quality control (RQC) complex YloA/Tae2 family protein